MLTMQKQPLVYESCGRPALKPPMPTLCLISDGSIPRCTAPQDFNPPAANAIYRYEKYVKGCAV